MIFGSPMMEQTNRWRVMFGSVAIEARKWSLANWGSEIWEFHDLHTHRNCKRDLTGTLRRISEISSPGNAGSDRREGDSPAVGEGCLGILRASRERIL